MTQENPKKMPVRNLERFSERKFNSYHGAKLAKDVLTVQPMTDSTKELIAKMAKAKIFARNDGTFDLVFYKKIVAEVPKTEEKVEEKKHFKKGKKQHA